MAVGAKTIGQNTQFHVHFKFNLHDHKKCNFSHAGAHLVFYFPKKGYVTVL